MWLISFIKQKMNYNMMFKIVLTISILLVINPCKVFATSSTYVVINEIYPFTKPDVLMGEIEKVMDAEENVCLCIMPIYCNTDYPAFYEFASIISYAQKKGCHVMIHFPLIFKDNPTVEEIESIINDNINIYNSFGIVIEGLIYEDSDNHKELAALLSQDIRVIELEDEELTKVLVDSNAYKTFEAEHLPKPRIENREIVIPEQYDFHRGIMDYISYNLEKSNAVLLVIVSVSIVSFFIMILYARHLNYTKFVGKRDSNKSGEK